MKTTNLRIPDELHKAIKQMAEHNRRSLNGEILRAIEFYLKNAPDAHYETKKTGGRKPSSFLRK